ncbi:hypothetical protein HWV62_10004 [Athelia sp. TMB]|nr:hypothetical protein HWV62_10004 [Athelia sp. TMB]
MDLLDADEEIGNVRSSLEERAITESSLSDNEDNDVIPRCPPPSSDPSIESPQGVSRASSSSSESYIIHYGSENGVPSDDRLSMPLSGHLSTDSIPPISGFLHVDGFPTDKRPNLLPSPTTHFKPYPPFQTHAPTVFPLWQVDVRPEECARNVAAADALPEPGDFESHPQPQTWTMASTDTRQPQEPTYAQQPQGATYTQDAQEQWFGQSQGPVYHPPTFPPYQQSMYQPPPVSFTPQQQLPDLPPPMPPTSTDFDNSMRRADYTTPSSYTPLESRPAPNTNLGLPLLPQHTSNNTSSSNSIPGPSMPAQGRGSSSSISQSGGSSSTSQLSTHSVEALRALLYTNEAQAVGPSRDVLTEHQAKKKGRMPDPTRLVYSQLRHPSASRQSSPSIWSIPPSAYSLPTTWSQSIPVHYSAPHPYAGPRTRDRQAIADRENLAIAGNRFISTIALEDCWMDSSPRRTDIARECINSANTVARRVGSPVTEIIGINVKTVEHFAPTWRSQAKKQTPLLLAYWEIFSVPLSISVAENLAYTRVTIGKALDGEAFLHEGRDWRSRDLIGDHYGDRLLFNRPSFLKYVDVIFYGPLGIARKVDTNFIQELFPLPCLAMAAAIIKGILTDYEETGIDLSAGVPKSSKRHSYAPYYRQFKKFLDLLAQSEYHGPLLTEILRKIATTGKATLQIGGGAGAYAETASWAIPEYVRFIQSEMAPGAVLPDAHN